MFDKLFEKIKRVDEIESKLLSIFEGKSWEYIAKALYQILDDIDTTDDMCKENVEAFRNIVMKLQAKKNEFLYSPDGYDLKRVSELILFEKSISQMDVGELLLVQRYWESLLPGKHVKSERDWLEEQLKDLKELLKNKPIESPPYTLEPKLDENLTDHARRELELAGMFDKEVEGSEAAGSWNNLCAEAVIELMEVFAKQRHSGMSASMTQELFSRLSKYEALTELTDSPDEWNDISEMQAGELGWQSQRNPSCFSDDGGKTYWDIEENYYKHEDEDGSVWSGGLSKEEWKNRPMHQSKHIEKKE